MTPFEKLKQSFIEQENGDVMTALGKLTLHLMDEFVKLPMKERMLAEIVEDNIVELLHDVRALTLAELNSMENLSTKEENPES
jgi:hypothetical protein